MIPKPYDALMDSSELKGVFLFSQTLPTSVNKLISIGLSDILFSGLDKSILDTKILLPPTYEVYESLGPAPKESKPLSHFPPKENLLSVDTTLF